MLPIPKIAELNLTENSVSPNNHTKGTKKYIYKGAL